MARGSDTFVQEFVIGLGFLSGLWIYAGIDPESALLGALVSAIRQLAPNSPLTFIFQIIVWIIPVISTFFSIAGAYISGKIVGVVAVGMAFNGGDFDRRRPNSNRAGTALKDRWATVRFLDFTLKNQLLGNKGHLPSLGQNS